MVLKEALSAISITLIIFCSKLLAKLDSSNLLSYMYFIPNYSLTIAALFNARKFSSLSVKIFPSRQRRRYQLRITTISRGKKRKQTAVFLTSSQKVENALWTEKIGYQTPTKVLVYCSKSSKWGGLNLMFVVFFFNNENLHVGHGWKQR